MSPLSPAPRPALGAVALAAALLLTACGGEDPAGGAPADDGATTATTSAGTAPATGAETAAGTTAEPAADGDEASAQGGAEPTESAAVEGPADGDEAHGDTTAGDGAAVADAAEENVAGERTDGSAAGGSSAGTRTGGGSPLCSTSQLDVAAAPAGGAAGSVHVDVVLTNAGEDPCTLAGYAGVSFVDAAGTMIGSPALRDASVPGTGRVVAPGESVTAGLRLSQAGNHPTCDARTAAGLRVYPPENTESVVIPFPVEACGDPRIHQLEIQGLGA